MMDPAEDPYHAGYRQGLLDREAHLGEKPSSRKRYLFAAGTFTFGVGSALVAGMLFSRDPTKRAFGQVLTFSLAVLGSSFAAAHILADEHPVTPHLKVKV